MKLAWVEHPRPRKLHLLLVHDLVPIDCIRGQRGRARDERGNPPAGQDEHDGKDVSTRVLKGSKDVSTRVLKGSGQTSRGVPRDEGVVHE